MIHPTWTRFLITTFLIIISNYGFTREITNTQTNRNINTKALDDGTAFTQIGPGTINITKGISEEKFQALSEELGVQKAALKSFFKILEQQEVPPEDLDNTLRTIAQRYKALNQKLATFTSEDPTKTGDIAAAQRIINQALQTARSIENSTDRANALSKIAIRSIENSTDRANALSKIAITQAVKTLNDSSSYFSHTYPLVLPTTVAPAN